MAEAEVREGKVVAHLPNQIFEVELDGGRKIRAHLASEMKMKYTRLLPGDPVQVEISAFDPGRGRIISRKA
jgi:translation initiation factor IF-1